MNFNRLSREKKERILKRLPKSDLHVHLDGSLRLSTIIELAKDKNISIPSYTEDGLKELIFKEKYSNLEEYLKTFGVTCSVMMNPEHLERISYELALDNISEGVRYIEPRFAPQLLINPAQSMEDILKAVDKGFKKAEREFNATEAVRNGEEPPFRYGIILCAMRNFGPWSDYYKSLFECFRFSRTTEIIKAAALEMAHAAVDIRNRLGLPVVAFDLAGAEAGNPASRFSEAFEYAHQNFLPKTVHAGEAYGAESIFQAITDLNADRIGHGFALFDKEKVFGRRIADKDRYIQNLVEYIAEKRITMEVCLTSNLQTLPEIGNLKNHSLGKMLEHRLSVVICTDNRLTSHTTVTDELMLMLEHFQISEKTLKNIILYGFKRSFFPGSYMEKRNYVRKCSGYYEKLIREEPELRN